MDIGNLIQNITGNSITATAIYGLVVLYAVDFATGVSAAIRDKVFQWEWLDVWVRANGTRLFNIIFVLLAGAAVPALDVLGFQVNPLTTLGVGWAATSAASAVASIGKNVNPGVVQGRPVE